MKHGFIMVALLALVGCSQIQTGGDRIDQLRDRILSCKTDKVVIVAHRGDWRYAPENSIAAIEHSIKIGADVVELDLQMTLDSVLIVMHDSKLDRTTTGKGKVAECTLDSIRTLKLKSGCGIATMHGVPTLEEALLASKGKVLVNLDKADRYFDQIVPVLEKTGTARQIIMKGTKPAEEVLALYGKYLDDVIYMPVIYLNRPHAKELLDGYVEKLKPAACELVYSDPDDTVLPIEAKQALEGKSLIWYNSLEARLCGGHDDDLALDDPQAAYGYLIDTLGARIIQTDRTEYLLSYLRSRKLHD